MTTSRRTLQGRLALVYAGVFFVSGLALLAIPVLLLLDVNAGVPAGGRASAGGSLATSQQGGDVLQLALGSAVALVVLVPLSFVLGWLLAGRLLRPLRTIIATAQDISARNLHRRLDLGRPDDELKELGTTLDDLFARLEASFESQRRFVANASHELRTPLAGQRALIQVALADSGASAETLRSTCEEALALGDMQERLIDALLTLAVSERGVERWEALDLAGVAGGVLASRRAEAERRGVRVEPALAPAPMAGDPSLVESLVANLVDNAIRHNLPGGRVEVATATTGGRWASIAVRNTGPVIADAEVRRLFEPFQRLCDGRTGRADGHGLGLAIVQAVAGAHGAALVARPRPGGGLDVDVRFPAGVEGV